MLFPGEPRTAPDDPVAARQDVLPSGVGVPYGRASDRVHSHTLPIMSCGPPSRAAQGKMPTGTERCIHCVPVRTCAMPSCHVPPQGWGPGSGPLWQAPSHQLTPTTGWAGWL